MQRRILSKRVQKSRAFYDYHISGKEFRQAGAVFFYHFNCIAISFVILYETAKKFRIL